MVKIYVKIPSNQWIFVKGTTSVSLGYKQSGKVRHVLVAETVNEPEVNGKPIKSIKIPSTKVMQIINGLIQSSELKNAVMVVDRIDDETYKLQVYEGDADTVSEIIRKTLIREKTGSTTG